MINKPVCQCTVTYVISVVHSVLVVIQYIVECCTCIKLKMAKRKLQTELSLQEKSEVLLRIQKGESQRKLAEQYGVSKTTIANIKKNEHSIINSVDSNSQNRKRKVRKTENEEVNNIMLEFFKKCRAQNIPVTGPMLQQRQRKLHQVCRLKNFLPAMVGWRRFGVGTISTSGHYVVNLPMSTKKQQMIGKGTWLLLLKVML